MALTRTFTQTHRHFRDSTIQQVEVDVARILGFPLVAECREVWIPGTQEETADLPLCDKCERLNTPVRKRKSKQQSRGSHRTALETRKSFPHYVYRCYDSANQLLYVGCTYTPQARLRQHRADGKGWMKDVDRVRFTVWPDRRKALDMERLAIETERPIHNRQFNQAAS